MDIPDDLFREVKAHAARRGTTLKACIIESLVRRMGGEEGGTAGRVELPLFGAPDAEAREAGNGEIQRILEEEEVADAKRFA